MRNGAPIVLSCRATSSSCSTSLPLPSSIFPLLLSPSLSTHTYVSELSHLCSAITMYAARSSQLTYHHRVSCARLDALTGQGLCDPSQNDATS